MKFKIWDKTNKKFITDSHKSKVVITLDGRVGMITTTGEIWIRTDCEIYRNNKRKEVI